MSAIHQLVAGYANGDAISNEARMLRITFRQWGYSSEIFCDPVSTTPTLRNDSRPLTELSKEITPQDTVLLHLSMGTDANRVFADLRCKKVLLYHNITPPHFFKAVNPRTARLLELGRRHMHELADCADINLADSHFNAAELMQAGYGNVNVFPLLLNLDTIQTPPDRKLMKNLAGIRFMLFVGRCAPNKRIEDLVSLTEWTRSAVDPEIRFFHVGSWAGTEPYQALIRAMASNIGENAFVFAGAVTQAELSAYYHSASLFVSMSEHEGFCIPVIESMVQNLPVLAYSAGAVPETMDGAGVLFHSKKYDALAEMCGELIDNSSLRSSVINKQQERIERYRQLSLTDDLRKMLTPLLQD